MTESSVEADRSLIDTGSESSSLALRDPRALDRRHRDSSDPRRPPALVRDMTFRRLLGVADACSILLALAVGSVVSG